MALVYGISGAQGAGKSTLLQKLQTEGYKIDTFKVSRSVQKELNIKALENVIVSFETMKQFQNEIIKQKYKHDAALAADITSEIILVERTFADIFAYTLLWCLRLHSDEKASLIQTVDFIQEVYDNCINGQLLYKGTLLIPFMNCIPWEEDPQRALKKDVDFIFTAISAFIINFKYQTINTESISDRSTEVINYIKGKHEIYVF